MKTKNIIASVITMSLIVCFGGAVTAVEKDMDEFPANCNKCKLVIEAINNSKCVKDLDITPTDEFMNGKFGINYRVNPGETMHLEKPAGLYVVRITQANFDSLVYPVQSQPYGGFRQIPFFEKKDSFFTIRTYATPDLVVTTNVKEDCIVLKIFINPVDSQKVEEFIAAMNKKSELEEYIWVQNKKIEEYLPSKIEKK